MTSALVVCLFAISITVAILATHAEHTGGATMSGTILVKLDKRLHQDLKREAKREGMSLNQLAVKKLSAPLLDYRKLPPGRKRKSTERSLQQILDDLGEL